MKYSTELPEKYCGDDNDVGLFFCVDKSKYYLIRGKNPPNIDLWIDCADKIYSFDKSEYINVEELNSFDFGCHLFAGSGKINSDGVLESVFINRVDGIHSDTSVKYMEITIFNEDGSHDGTTNKSLDEKKESDHDNHRKNVEQNKKLTEMKFSQILPKYHNVDNKNAAGSLFYCIDNDTYYLIRGKMPNKTKWKFCASQIYNSQTSDKINPFDYGCHLYAGSGYITGYNVYQNSNISRGPFIHYGKSVREKEIIIFDSDGVIEGKTIKHSTIERSEEELIEALKKASKKLIGKHTEHENEIADKSTEWAQCVDSFIQSDKSNSWGQYMASCFQNDIDDAKNILNLLENNNLAGAIKKIRHLDTCVRENFWYGVDDDIQAKYEDVISKYESLRI